MSRESGLDGERGRHTHSAHNSHCYTHTKLLGDGAARGGGGGYFCVKEGEEKGRDHFAFSLNATEETKDKSPPPLKAGQTGFSDPGPSENL